jgi:hypothetical protein
MALHTLTTSDSLLVCTGTVGCLSFSLQLYADKGVACGAQYGEENGKSECRICDDVSLLVRFCDVPSRALSHLGLKFVGLVR